MPCKCICCEHINLKFSQKKTKQGYAPCKLSATKSIGNILNKERECDNYKQVNDEELNERRAEYKRVREEGKQLGEKLRKMFPL